MNVLSKTQLDNYIDDDFSKELENLCKISKESLDEKEKKSFSSYKESNNDLGNSFSGEELDNECADYVIQPVKINTINIDIEQLKLFVKEYMLPRLEYYKSTKTKNLEIESGFSEWWISKISNGIKIGDGNCPFDVLTSDKKGIDVMCICINGNQSNEKSIIQNFKDSGNNLDNYFKEKKYNEAINIFLQDYNKKLITFINKYKCNELYYLAFISTSKHVYLSSFKININKLENVIVDKTTKEAKSIIIKYFINDIYGNTKLYKNKKRIELRLYKKILTSFNTIIIY
jgi:hypothetical protein